MEIEYLKFRVDPERREEFIQNDDLIWNPILYNAPGFLRKEIWISPDQLDEVIIVVRWASFEQWKAVPPPLLQQAEAEFSSRMGNSYELLESLRYQMRRMASTSSS